MTERERLVEIVKGVDIMRKMRQSISECADYLLDNGVIVPPCEVVWYIANRNTEFECVMSANIEDLPLHIVKNLDKYKYYECKEEAEKALENKECEK